MLCTTTDEATSDFLCDDDLASAVAMDCEMVMVEGNKSVLARCCCVSYDEHILLDLYAAPERPVVDYLTRYSGIRPKDLLDAPSFHEVRSAVAALVEGKILIGHGIHNDLKALQLQHPKALLIDTAVLEWGLGRAINLKALSRDVLGAIIQQGGHSPYEDALASLRLLKAHRRAGGVPPPSKGQEACAFLKALARPELPGCRAEPAEEGVWRLVMQWSDGTLRQLLEWYADAAEGDGESHAAAPLLFEATLPRAERNLLHKEARRLGLATQSQGIGAARAVRVLPRGQAPPERSAPTRRVASLIYRWTRDAAEQDGDEAAPPPFSLGEVEEMVDESAAGRAVPCAIVPFVRRALAVLPTTPQYARDGEQLAQRASERYAQALVLRGELRAVRSGGRAKSKGSPGSGRRRK